jgi:hypothetical protein
LVGEICFGNSALGVLSGRLAEDILYLFCLEFCLER